MSLPMGHLFVSSWVVQDKGTHNLNLLLCFYLSSFFIDEYGKHSSNQLSCNNREGEGGRANRNCGDEPDRSHCATHNLPFPDCCLGRCPTLRCMPGGQHLDGIALGSHELGNSSNSLINSLCWYQSLHDIVKFLPPLLLRYSSDTRGLAFGQSRLESIARPQPFSHTFFSCCPRASASIARRPPLARRSASRDWANLDLSRITGPFQ